MSQENVELVRRGYESWKATRQFDFGLLAQEIEWDTAAVLDGGVALRGHDGVRRWFRQMLSIWEDVWWEVDQLEDYGDRVLASVRAYAQGRGSGVPVEMPLYNLWTIRDGKAVQMKSYLNHAEALEAAGQSE